MPTLIAMRSFLQQLAYLLRDIIGRETKMREYVGRLARRAEAVDAEHATGVAHVTPPALGRTRLHGEAARERARQDALAVRGVLRVERLGPRHRHQAHAPAGGVRSRYRLRRDADLGTGRDHQALGRAAAIEQNVAAAADVGQLRRRAWLLRQRLAGEYQRRGALALDGERPGHGGFRRITRTPQIHVRYGAQAAEVLDRLVGRPVLAEADGVMRVHQDDAQVHQAA